MDNYNPTAVDLPATIQTTADGDAPTGATLGGPQQVLANGIRAVQDVAKPLAGSGDLLRVRGHYIIGDGESIYTDTATLLPIVQPSNGATNVWEIFPPHGSRLRSATLRHHKGAGTALTVKIYSVDLGTSVDLGGDIDDVPQVTELATATGPTPTDQVQSTQASVAGDGHLVDRTTKRYLVVVTGPGTASTAKFFGVLATVRIPAGASIDQGAG